MLATPPNGGRPLAFEVQWSDQTLDTTLARQAAYAADGVRGCWFFRRPPAQDAPDHALPLFGLALDAEERQGVSSPHVLAPWCGDGPSPAWPLDDFVAALLARRIRFRAQVTASDCPAGRIIFFLRPCAASGREVLLWYVVGRAVRACSGCGTCLNGDRPVGARSPLS